MRELTLRNLRIFEAAASAGSFSRAAEALGMTQSAVSQQIRILEEEVRTKLFDTQGRPIQLTDAGRELLQHARLILAQVSIATDSLASMEGEFRGQLHIGVVSPSNYFIPALMAVFRQKYPAIRMKVTMGNRRTLLTMLAEHRLDLVIGGYPPEESEVEVHSFARHPHCLVASPDNPLTALREINWRDLGNEPFIMREAGSTTRKFLEHLLQVQGLQVNANLELEGNETVKQAVMVGLGITFLSAHVFQLELQTGKLAVLDVIDMPKWLDWCLITRREASVPAVRQAFCDFVIADGAKFVHCELQARAVT